MSSCQRCKQSSNGPQAFLLACRGCRKTWHHRCHMPPVEDGELIRRIRATNAGDTANGLSSWTCRRCKKASSETPSVGSSREPTVTSNLREDSKSCTSNSSPAITDITASTASLSVAPTVDVCVRQETNTALDARPPNDQEQGKKSTQQESTEAAPKKHVLTAKRTKPSATKQSHVEPPPERPTQPRDEDVQMADITPTKSTPQEKIRPQRPSPTPFYQGKSARKTADTVPETSSEDDVEMMVGDSPVPPSEPTMRATSPSSQAPLSDNQAVGPMPVVGAQPHVRAASPASRWEREVRPADETAIQRRVNQGITNEDEDDPDDLYGPPVERRIIRILPSLAEELREQQRRTAAEKEKRRAPLASDWILARHIHDPSWKEIPAEVRKRRKAAARKLGDNGLNVNELMGCFTVENWVREHKT